MKKKLESELVSIAHRILKLKGKEDVIKMHDEVKVLYEKLSVLKFAHENFVDDIPTIGNDSSFFEMLDTAFNNKVSDTIEVEDKIYINLDDIEDDGIMEPVMEKIKDIVAQMPHEAEQVDILVEEKILEIKPEEAPASTLSSESETEFDHLTADFRDLPEFEPKNSSDTQSERIKSINDKFKGRGLVIGLNDKLAFIKHLFEGKREDYERVLSQLNTVQSYNEAESLIKNRVKPDYNNWQGKEDVEERFMEILESRFD